MRYRKKPIQVQALCFDGSMSSFLKIKNLNEKYKIVYNFVNRYESYLIIQTLEGEMKANIGDYIIKGIKGELYPCKKKIFEQTYEAV